MVGFPSATVREVGEVDSDTGMPIPAGDHATHTIEIAAERPAALDLYWIPLGAGNPVVEFSGRAFEAVAARWSGRSPGALFHTALVATVGADRYFVEMTPVPSPSRAVPDRGVVAEGAVGTAWARRLRVFRYEIRRWRNGHIPDLAHAVGGPVPITHEEPLVLAALDAVPLVPTPVWGRDELHAGEMWNSNSVVSWVLTSAGLPATATAPLGGRAPGWNAGVVVATGSITGSSASR